MTKPDPALRRAIARHAVYLSQSWRSAPPGLPTFEAVCGLIQSGLALKGMEPRVRPAVKVLEELCRREIGADGGLPGRNPEELLDLFALLVWCEAALEGADLMAQPQHRAAIARIAPVLRATQTEAQLRMPVGVFAEPSPRRKAMSSRSAITRRMSSRTIIAMPMPDWRRSVFDTGTSAVSFL